MVVWQRTVFSESNEIGGYSIASTELWYSVFDGTEWLPAQKVDASINGVINNYSVAMNGSDIAITLFVFDNESEMSDNIYTIHIKNAKQKSPSATQNRITFYTNVNANPQIAKYNDGFIFSYYTVISNSVNESSDETSFISSNDIVIGVLNSDGSVNHNAKYNISEAAGLLGVEISNNHIIITNDNNDMAVVWAAYNPEKESNTIYSSTFINKGEIGFFSAPIELDLGTQQVGDVLTLLDGIIENDGNIKVLYNSIKYTISEENYELVVSEDENRLAYGTFTNSFIYGISADDSEASPECELPIQFQLVNTGITSIDKIIIDWGNGIEPTIWDVNIKPNEIFMDDTAYITLGNKIENLSYTVHVHYQGDDSGKYIDMNGVLILAKPDISIGNVTVTKSEKGVREFAVNLYNLSDISLAGSGNSVHLSFYRDIMLTEPISVDGITNINTPEQLSLIDDGGLSLTYSYTFTQDDLSNGEIPSEGMRIFITAEVRNGNNVVEESDYTANRANVLLNSLLRHNQAAVVASLNNYEKDGTTSTANISVFNRSMKNVPANSGRVVAHLVDENGNIIETQTRNIENTLGKEETLIATASFSQSGHDIIVSYDVLSQEINDTSLSSLALSSIPFVFDDTITPTDGVIRLQAGNIHSVNTTSLTASAKNPNAVIVINDVEYSDIASTDISLLTETTTVNIEVTVGNFKTTYVLTITSEPVPTYTVRFNVDGTIVSSTTVYSGGMVSRPENPTKEGYVFNGWRVGSVSGELYDFNTQIISDITLYAQWTYLGGEITYYTVTFDLNGGTRTGGDLTQTVVSGGSAIAPNLNREGYTFNGWDRPFNNVTDNITVTAQWIPNTAEVTYHTVTFDLNGGTRIGGGDLTQTVASGGSATAPTVSRSNYTFNGWDRSFTDVTSNMIVTAQWTYNTPYVPPYIPPTQTPTNPPTTADPDEITDTVKGIINGTQVELIQNADGSVSLVLTAGDIAKYPQKNNIFNIEISNQKNVNITLPISALGDISVLHIKTDMGTVILTQKMLQAYSERYGDILTISIKSGSMIVDFIKDGKPVNYNDSANPLIISIPVMLAADTNTNGYVAVKKESSRNIIIPLSIYKDKEIVFQTPSTGTYDVIYNAKTFSDTNNHWAARYITFTSARGMFSGVGNDLFSPDTPMTRAMFAQVLANIESVDLSVYKTSRFTDVDDTAWYMAAVEWAADKGIVNGVGDGQFNPEANVTREQMAVMLSNYIRYKQYVLPTVTMAAFTDESSISSWAFESVKMIQASGIVSGRPGNIYDPSGMATRAEVATIFARFVDIYINNVLENASANTSTVATNANDTSSSGSVIAYFDKSALEELEQALMGNIEE